MWPVLFAVAVAGSGFFARRLFSSNDDSNSRLVSQRTEKCEQEEEHEESANPVSHRVLISPLCLSDLGPSGVSEFGDSWNCERLSSGVEEEEIFRFSSLGYGDGTGLRLGSKSSRKKGGFGSRKFRGNVDGFKRRVGVLKFGKNSGFADGVDVVVEENRKKGRKFSVCLKKRRTGKNAIAKCGSCSSTKGCSFFSWGLGVGIMYMVSAGKAEINKLNTVVDETAKVVQELKGELHKRKLSRDLRHTSLASKVDTCPNKIGGKHAQPACAKSFVEEDIKVFGVPLTDDGEGASSVLTEEPEPEVLEMDQLEAELESELQKLPWCVTKDTPSNEGSRSDLGEFVSQLDPDHFVDVANTELSANGIPGLPGPREPEEVNTNSYQFHGVLPSELDQKLCHLLIEQQESQIGELEFKLLSAQTKLHQKEAELQALKNCFRGLTDLSLTTASGMVSDLNYPSEHLLILNCTWD
ncbi:hypothetical protein HHK36_011145 [Tetracentron sinense]|uniref:Uncharacterized protein n=1 Tax=Tetracentron sinense TaxID=13715 RepID=A0A835DH27_TETSI|nr:hypothetical protein HHK36_011145 [Tetracentron sinense]